MSVFRQIMMRKKNVEIYAPANAIFTKAGEGIKCYTTYSSRTYTKDYDGLAYGGIAKWQDNGDWQLAIFVSESKEACMSKGAGQYPSTISDTPFNYKGKNWYYVTNGSAMTTQGMTKGESYIINENFYSGTQAEQVLQCAKALIDYVYNFTASNISVCDYIETTGTQWIDTRLVPTSNTRVVTIIKTTTTEQAIIVFGCANSALYYYLVPYDNKWYYGLSGTESYAGTYNGIIGQEYEIDFNNNGNIIINNNTIVSGISPSGKGNLLIANRNNALYGKWQYQSFKVYESGVLIRDLVPIYISSIQKYGFLDAVAKTTYLNSGTGDLTGGND